MNLSNNCVNGKFIHARMFWHNQWIVSETVWL